MAVFEADRGFHLSDNGTKPWAHFKPVKGAAVARFRFETTDPKVIDRLAGVPGVTRVDAPAPRRRGSLDPNNTAPVSTDE
jgi:hypothetical protein